MLLDPEVQSTWVNPNRLDSGHLRTPAASHLDHPFCAIRQQLVLQHRRKSRLEEQHQLNQVMLTIDFCVLTIIIIIIMIIIIMIIIIVK